MKKVTHPSLSTWQRKVIHIDMDAFFAAVEQRDHPKLRGKPVVVGGDPFGRGVVSTASYEARKFGIHSAMPAHEARRRCPEAIFLRPCFEKYREASDVIMAILRQHTQLVESASVDEAYLDVTEHRFGIQDPAKIASLIKQTIFAVTRLTASAGVAPNFFLAKVASDLEKPNGLTVIEPESVMNFLEDLPVRKIPGVGPVTEKSLVSLRIQTCGQLARTPLSFLTGRFGKFGRALHQRSYGQDEREVEPCGAPKQSSSEETFLKDTCDKEWMKQRLESFAKEVFNHVTLEKLIGKTVVLKVKYYDFEQITRSRTLLSEPVSWNELYTVAVELLDKKTLAGQKKIRLLGLGLSGLKEKEDFHGYELFKTS